MSARIVLPRIMHVGKGASRQIADTMVTLGVCRPLIITDQVMVELGVFKSDPATINENRY